ncbi:MAG: sulfotransferase family protein [Thermodesulfobacteriota bacterium]|nr:sulfotransferase family protein [Thermodesulfobacteriota bacterium]
MLSLFNKNPAFYKAYPIKLNRNIIENGLAISTAHKYVYARVYKSANSTVISSLYNAENNNRIIGLDDIQKIKDNYFTKPGELSKIDLENLDSYYKFTIVRNPYRRILSAYLDKIKNRNGSKRKIVTKLLNKNPNDQITFNEFLGFLENGGLRQNGHWAPQTDFLVFPIDQYNYIGKLENLQKDLTHILTTTYGKDCPIVSVNEHKTDSRNKTKELTASDKLRIYNLYMDDFKNFNYDF